MNITSLRWSLYFLRYLSFYGCCILQIHKHECNQRYSFLHDAKILYRLENLIQNVCTSTLNLITTVYQ